MTKQGRLYALWAFPNEIAACKRLAADLQLRQRQSISWCQLMQGLAAHIKTHGCLPAGLEVTGKPLRDRPLKGGGTGE